jgi:uncharacterized Tic20 family protein
MELANWHKLNTLLTVFSVISIFALALITTCNIFEKSEKSDIYIKICIFVAVFSMIGMVFIPSVAITKDENGRAYYYKMEGK